MIRFLLDVLKYFVLINVLFFASALLVDGEYEFGSVANVVVPVLCALAEVGVRRQKAGRAVRQR